MPPDTPSVRPRARAVATRRGALILAILALTACTGSEGLTRSEPRGSARVMGATVTRLGSGPSRPCHQPLRYLVRTQRGIYPGRSPEISWIPAHGSGFGNFGQGMSHSGPWDFLQEVPLVFYGPGFVEAAGELRPSREVTLADLTPTLAELLGVPPPRSAVGKTIDGVLLPARARARDLRLIVTVVWDGGGWNTLEAHPRRWPFLARLMEKGASVRPALVGSSPSITPAVHATIGTGAFPNSHGLVSILQRSGGLIVQSTGEASAHLLEAPTLADSYDQLVAGARVGLVARGTLHLPMIGHGAAWPGGDEDVAVLVAGSEGEPIFSTSDDQFELPDLVFRLDDSYRASIRGLDASDGKRDGMWKGHASLDDPAAVGDVVRSPALVPFQTKVIEALIEDGGFGRDRVADLLYTNYKDIDHLGHVFTMGSDEVGEAIELSDDALEDLVRMLDRRVGRRKWVIAVTADHGQGPGPRSIGAWAIDQVELEADIERLAGTASGEVIDHLRPSGLWLDPDALDGGALTLERVIRFVRDYRIEDNLVRGQRAPRAYRDRLEERVFATAFRTDRMDSIVRCARARRAEGSD